ncbi:hypothetical protein AMTR_s00033p00075560 [Amborella trichopoda]|uniref:Uncharacterized protein n=1 Tax=Amborella trichopoda TaxID=13333 RepID=U5CYH7_AMBTC|nr:hypothetical protein AMTR_s00033p00075560 [Amborella trichopoda]
MTTQRVTIIELSQEKPIKIIDPTTFNDLPEGASKMNFSLWDHSFLWGHISVSMPSLEAKAEDLFKALFIVRSPYTPPIVVTESSDSSSFEDLSSCIRNWMPSKVEKKKVVWEKATKMVQMMGVQFKGTFKVVEDALKRDEI